MADTWSFKTPEQPEAYDPLIDGKTELVKFAKLKAASEKRRQDHQIYLGVEDVIKQLIIKAYVPCWLEEIEDNILEFTVKSAKEMLDHLVTQSLKVTNQEKKTLIKNMEFPWLAEEDVNVYFVKLEKEQVKLKAMGINLDDTQKVTQAIEEMYSIHIFDKIQLMEWKDKAENDKMWEN